MTSFSVGDVVQLDSHRARRAARLPSAEPAATPEPPAVVAPFARALTTQALLESASRGFASGVSRLLGRYRGLGRPDQVTAALGAIDARLEDLRQTRRHTRRIVTLIGAGDLAACEVFRDQLLAEQAAAR